jgi:hypothetical protein
VYYFLDIHLKTGAALKKAFATIPKAMDTVIVRSSSGVTDLSIRDSLELARAFACLPYNIKILDLTRGC